MSCDITAGRSVDCKNAIAGIKAVYFHNYADLKTLPGFAETSGYVTEVSTTAPQLFKYAVRPESCDASSDIMTDAGNGTTYFQQRVTLSLINLTQEDSDQLKLLAYGRPNVFILDNNDRVFIFGARNGMNVSDGGMKIGRGFGDFQGYELTLEGKEDEFCLWVEPTAGAGTAAYPFDGLSTAPSITE